MNRRRDDRKDEGYCSDGEGNRSEIITLGTKREETGGS